MEILELELKQIELQNFLNELSSDRTKLLRLSEFFNSVLSSSNPNLKEIYVTNLFSEYLSLLERIKIRGLTLDNFTFILNQFDKLKDLGYLNCYKAEIEQVRDLLEKKFDLLSSWLNGAVADNPGSIIYFPVLERYEPERDIGFLEIIKVKILDGENKFIVEPYESENDAQLQKQMHICWKNAIEYCRRYINKIKSSHTVELKFENRLAVYIGSSFGIAVTLAFIEAILKHYNSKTIVNINGCVAVTGGIDHNSKIISTSKTIIETKVVTVFYSDASIFCIPKIDEMWAEEKLKELKTKYPNRKLRIIGLTDLNDLLDRRQIVDIRKQKLIVRGGKFVKKNWVSAAATILLAMVLAYLYVLDFDDNPAVLTTDGYSLFVKNKSDKILWAKKIGVPKEVVDNRRVLDYYCRIFDIDNDGRNEVFIAGEMSPNENIKNSSISLLCYDPQGTVKWRYSFEDSVTSEREILQTNYGLTIIDTLTFNNTKSLFLISSSTSSFNSAIYRISLETGKRLPGTLWSSGHTVEAIIKDLNNDGKADLLAVGVDNGFEESVVWACTADTLTQVIPSTKEYNIKSFPSADLMSYIRIPKNDFENYNGVRITGIGRGSLFDDLSEKKYRFAKYCDDDEMSGYLWMKLDYNLMDFDIIVDNQFRVIRDTLVAKGELRLPYTDTEEYKNIIKNNMLYWKNSKWVKRDELD